MQIYLSLYATLLPRLNVYIRYYSLNVLLPDKTCSVPSNTFTVWQVTELTVAEGRRPEPACSVASSLVMLGEVHIEFATKEQNLQINAKLLYCLHGYHEPLSF